MLKNTIIIIKYILAKAGILSLFFFKNKYKAKQ
jgi:hypothetical protein